MIEYFKNVDSGYVVSVSTGSGAEKISGEEYAAIVNAIENRPIPLSGFDYKLRADTLEWELVELPPMPEPEPTVEDKA